MSIEDEIQDDSQVEGQIESGETTDTAVAEAPVQAEPQQQAQPHSPWDAFKRLPEFQGADDRAIAARLYASMEREKVASRALAQYQQVLPHAQDYLVNRPEFEAWRKSQQAQKEQHSPAAQQQQPEKPKSSWWNPPQVREAYKRYLTKDEDGREVISQDAPLDARHELFEYQQYKADFAKRFLEDPQGALGPMIQEMAAKQAQEIVEQQFTHVNNEQYVQSLEEKNRDWLFDPQTGNVTPEGFLVHKYIEEAREHGISGPQQRWQYAIAMTERDMLAQAFDASQAIQARPQQQPAPQFAPQQPAPQPAPAPQTTQAQPDLAQQNMQYLRREAARNPSRSAGTASNDPRTPKPKRSFTDMLKEEASSKGLI